MLFNYLFAHFVLQRLAELSLVVDSELSPLAPHSHDLKNSFLLFLPLGNKKRQRCEINPRNLVRFFSVSMRASMKEPCFVFSRRPLGGGVWKSFYARNYDMKKKALGSGFFLVQSWLVAKGPFQKKKRTGYAAACVCTLGGRPMGSRFESYLLSVLKN